MKYDCLIKNGKLVTDRKIEEGAVAVLDGKIAEIILQGELPDARERWWTAGGQYVFPGAIDTHAHPNEPGYEWREDYSHGTRRGGTRRIYDGF